MKKTPAIILTILLSFSISLSSAQNNPEEIICPPDTFCTNVDTTDYQLELPTVTYDYYFRVRFFDRMFRFCFPRRYHRLVYGTGHICHPPIYHYSFFHAHWSGFTHMSCKRGGFGYHGSHINQSN